VFFLDVSENSHFVGESITEHWCD